ncbi:hypothetical protein LAZ67_16001179 [Cordylochernes scorpioides]|uniref:ADP-dependent glucokinase n=1 Tax=Cordylochernes scorpioides TaxID=51811 RepID=A0ABY6LDA3_9ARAC|nr:hypothetical protein LAZ67_16001179 [Cordylochernes scorpioides]
MRGCKWHLFLMSEVAISFGAKSACQRYVANTSLFQDLVLTAARAPGVRWELGGNAAVMASRFAKEGWQPLLGSQVSPQLQSMVPPRVHLSGPQVARDDVHLLLEYPSGASWGPFSAPRANRFIIHSDHQNPLLISLENFAERLSGWEPHLVVVGGLQMLDNFPLPPAVRKDRLDRLRHMLVQQHAPVHFEMASFTDVSLMQAITDSLLPHTDSLGMNEQELPNLHNLVVYGNVSLVAESTPRVAPVLDQMRELFAALNKRTASVSGSKRLTRLHVHTLAFQAILTSKDSPWRNTKNAAAKAALTANRHTCGTRHVDPSRSRILLDDSFTTSLDPKLARKIPFSQEDPVTCWEEDQDLGFCLAPVLVCTDVLQTGGGGDNVSSAGLVLQI